MSQYSPAGFQADLPELNLGRWDHACAGYYDDLEHFVLLVAGGNDFEGVNTIILYYATLQLFIPQVNTLTQIHTLQPRQRYLKWESPLSGLKCLLYLSNCWVLEPPLSIT